MQFVPIKEWEIVSFVDAQSHAIYLSQKSFISKGKYT